MIKNKFFVYFLKLWIDLFGAIIILDLMFLSLYIHGVFNGASNFFLRVCLWTIFGFTTFYFVFLSFLIFQIVIIDEEGIKIILIKKVIKKCKWEEVKTMYLINNGYGTKVAIELFNKTEIYLEHRKKIVKAIEYYSKRTVNGFRMIN